MRAHDRAPDTMSIEELATILGISRTFAYTLAQRDQLPVPTIRLGRRRLISRRAVEQLLMAEPADRPDQPGPVR